MIEIYNMATNGSINWFIDRADEEGKEKWEAGIVENGNEQVEAEIIVKAILDEQDETNRKIYFYYYIGRKYAKCMSGNEKKIKNLPLDKPGIILYFIHSNPI